MNLIKISDMKSLLTLFLLISILSCNNGFQYEKKRYSKGYYFSHAKKKKAATNPHTQTVLKGGRQNQGDTENTEISQISLQKIKEDTVKPFVQIEKFESNNQPEVPDYREVNYAEEQEKVNKGKGNEAAIEEEPDLSGHFIAGALLLSMISGMYFLPQSARVRKLAKIGARNKRWTIMALVGLKAGLAAVAYLAGSMLSDLGLALPEWLAHLSVGTALGCALLYPRKTKSREEYSRSFLRRKTCDLGLVLGSAFILMGAGNTGKLSDFTILPDSSLEIRTDSALCDSSKLIMLSESLGTSIDSIEKTKYKLFPYWNTTRFELAQICDRGNGQYAVIGKMKDGSIKEMLINEPQLKMLRDQVTRHDANVLKPTIRRVKRLHGYMIIMANGLSD